MASEPVPDPYPRAQGASRSWAGPWLSVAERLELSLEAASDAVVWTDEEGRVQWCNARFSEAVQLARDAIVGRQLTELLPVSSAGGNQPAEHPVTAVLKGRAQLSAGCEIRKGDSTTYWQLAGSWITPANEAPMALFWLHEVTQQRLAERVGNRLAAVREVTREAVVCWDLDGRLTHWNAAASRLYGYAQEEALGRPYSLLLPEAARATLEADLARIRAGGSPVSLEANHRRRDGRLVRVERTLAGWPDEEGRLCGFVLVARDVTEQRRVEAMVARQMQELERSNMQLEQFALTVSHDLLEPLRKITTFGGLLEKNASHGLDERGRDFLGRMTDAAVRMTKLIEDLLQFSRVFGDTMPVEPVALGPLVREVLQDLETRISEAAATVEVAEPLPTVLARAFQMRQLFQNLISNALKFRTTDHPPRVTIESAQGDAGFVDVLVRDNGIGFEQSEADRIFEPFMRLHAREEYEGSGIGLAVCRRIVLRHGGWISAKSIPGVGTTFTVSFPTIAGPPS